MDCRDAVYPYTAIEAELIEMKKEDFIRLIVCEHWFSLKSWKGKDWDDKRKKAWISGMHRAWNLIHPTYQIKPLEINMLMEQWDKKEAEDWYNAYCSKYKIGSLEHIPKDQLRWYLVDYTSDSNSL